MSTVYIYALIDPIGGDVRYVGKTFDLKMRDSQHFTSGLKVTDKKSEWIAALRAQGKRPKMVTLEECTLDTWAEAEKRWIAHYRFNTPFVTNKSVGGNGHSFPKKWDAKLTSVKINKEMSEQIAALEAKGHNYADIVRSALDMFLSRPFKGVVPYERKYHGQIAGMGISTETRDKMDALRNAGQFESDIIRTALYQYLPSLLTESA